MTATGEALGLEIGKVEAYNQHVGCQKTLATELLHLISCSKLAWFLDSCNDLLLNSALKSQQLSFVLLQLWPIVFLLSHAGVNYKRMVWHDF